MKPDGVATAVLEPMETLESNPVNDGAPPGDQEPNQAASGVAEVMPQQLGGEGDQEKPQGDQAKETPAAKTNNKTSGDPKAKSTNKTATKTKPGNTTQSKAATGSRPNTSQSRVANGVSKPQTNGVAKKTTPAADKKSTLTSASSKKPTGTAGAPASKTLAKVSEKKAPATNGAKSTTGTTAAKKTPSTNANGVKSNTAAAAAAKKPPAPKPASTKPGSVASPKPDKPPVSKTTRPTTGTTSSPRPATGSSRPPTSSNAKSSPATTKPATPKTPSAAAKPATPKPTSTTPSGGKPPSQTSKTTTLVKKDVTKPSTPAAKKPADSPLTRPSSTTKSAKSETSKSASKSEVTAKKPATNKPADTKTPNRPKTQESKPTPAKTPGSKTKTSSPKKTVGSSTPTPVKRAPKAATAAEPEKEVAAAVAAAAAIAATAAVIAVPEQPEPPAELAVEPSITTPEEKSAALTPEPELVCAPVAESVCEPKLEPARESIPEPAREPTPEPAREPTPEPVRESTPVSVREPTPEPVREPTLEPAREPTPEPVREPTPVSVREPTPEPVREPTPEPAREPTPEPVREPTPEPAREPTPEPVRELTPEPVREPSPEPVREPTPEPVQELISHQEEEPSPEASVDLLSDPPAEEEAEPVHEAVCGVQLPAQIDPFKFEEPANDSLGTTVMSPPCSPQGPASPVRDQQNAYSLLGTHVHSDPWNINQSPSSMMNFQREEEQCQQFEAQETQEEEEDEEQEEEEKENLFMHTPAAPEAFNNTVQPHLLGASPLDDFSPRGLISPHEKEEAVEKADEEINEDDDEEEDDDDEEQRRLGYQPSSLITDMSTSQPSDDFQVRSSAFGGSTGWHGDDLLSGMDSEDVSSCTSSRQQGVSDLSSTQHTAILEGTQSSDALVDTSLRGSEGDGNLMGSPNVETLANEEEDEDDEDERVDDMDLSSERVDEHHKVFQEQGQDEEEDEDVEMRSEGVMESCENEDDFNEEAHLDNLNQSGPPPSIPASSWGQTNPFCDTWAQPASLLSVSSPSPVSDHGAAESEAPTQSPAQACLDVSAPSFAPEMEQETNLHQSSYEETKGSVLAEAPTLLAAPPVGMSQSSTLSGTALAAQSSSETSTPEELRDYDSSSGVESRSDKQQTPVPASVQPDMEQDLGIHLEKGDGEEEEAETLPADEVLGTGPPTAPASAPSSPSTSGDEASDTEGEMQINDPEAPMMVDESAGFESPPQTCSLPALEEDEEAGDTPAGEGEEDGGGATPQSANSVASYGFDCTTSNSNAHSMAESCGKSPGIFSLENEEQLPEEAKDPSLIKELTLPPAATSALAEDLLGRSVDLMPLGHPEDNHPSLDDHHYMLGGKIAADQLKDIDPVEAEESGGTGDNQASYYSTISDKTDSFLAGDWKRYEVDEAHRWQKHSQEDNQNQNHTAAAPIANGHYLAMVPGNRRPIDPTLAAHFAKIAPPPSLTVAAADGHAGGEQLKRLEQHQEKLREMQQRQVQERQKRQWLEEERLRLEQQKQLEKQRRELLQLQLQQQQQEHRHRRQVLQWQLELEQQYRMQQKQIQQQQQLRRSPTGVMLSPSSGLCTIYEAMETSDEEDEARGEVRRRGRSPHRQQHLRPVPPQELEWNKKVDMVQQLINQTMVLSGDTDCPPLLLLPVGTGGTLSPLESSMWPSLFPQFSPPTATVTSVSSYSPDSQGSSPISDWTVVEVETHH
ncbi:treacle protein [Astatotilapia calliptera]|uniref:treacle protein n=1 Tax=Astatotilapia calliptera TaxID=8154 RepID=UPI000E41BD20|nr:treacle protein-like [Astatotilapia calliptera]XP_026021547.1 treacle protein-like [Astatotilapia calliptera]